jgi:hypothetical protein
MRPDVDPAKQCPQQVAYFEAPVSQVRLVVHLSLLGPPRVDDFEVLMEHGRLLGKQYPVAVRVAECDVGQDVLMTPWDRLCDILHRMSYPVNATLVGGRLTQG